MACVDYIHEALSNCCAEQMALMELFNKCPHTFCKGADLRLQKKDEETFLISLCVHFIVNGYMIDTNSRSGIIIRQRQLGLKFRSHAWA